MGLAEPWFLLLAPLPLLAWLALPVRRETGAIRVPGSVLTHLIQHSRGSPTALTLRPGDLAPKIIGWLALVLALAGPVQERPSVLTPTGRDVVIAFDLSASMAERDMVVGTEKLARIDVIRDQLGTFIRGRRGDRIALIGFATEAFVISPLSHDVRAIAEMLDEVSIGLPGRKTDLGQAIGMTVKLLRPEEQGERLLILISDGEVNSGEIAATDAAGLAARLGVKILTIGFATEIAAENISQLAEVSQMTGGSYRVATDPDLMQQALDWLDDMAPVIPDQTMTERRTDWRWLPLIVALACLFAIGWREYRDP